MPNRRSAKLAGAAVAPRARPLRAVRAKPGRPSAERAEAINKAIVIAARNHFLAKGYEQTSIDDVADSARISKSTLHARYPTKEALRLAVVVHELEHLDALAQANWEPKSPDLKRCLRRQAQIIGASLISPEARALDRLVADGRNAGGKLSRILHERQEGIIAEIAADITERAGAKISSREAVRVAEILFTSVFGWVAVRRVSGEPSSEEVLSFANDLVDMIWTSRSRW